MCLVNKSTPMPLNDAHSRRANVYAVTGFLDRLGLSGVIAPTLPRIARGLFLCNYNSASFRLVRACIPPSAQRQAALFTETFIYAMKIKDLSRIIHDRLFRDTSESLCSRAYRLRHHSRFWRAWVFVFTERHCRASYLWHWRNK